MCIDHSLRFVIFFRLSLEIFLGYLIFRACLRSLLWKQSILLSSPPCTVQSSEFAKKIGAMQALNILPFLSLFILLLHIMLFVVFITSRAKIFRLVMSFSVFSRDPRYLHAPHLSSTDHCAKKKVHMYILLHGFCVMILLDSFRCDFWCKTQ